MTRLSRTLFAAAALAAIQPATARAQTLWDFAQLAGGNGVLGSSYDFFISGLGTVTAFTTDGFRVTSKGYNTAYPNEEKGLGICVWFGTGCSGGDEIGDGSGNTGSLYLNLLGLNFNEHPLSVFLASVQAGEGWNVRFSTDGSCSAGSSFGSPVSGSGPNSGGAYVNLPVATSVTCIRFDPVATGSGGKDYLLASLTTNTLDRPQETVPEPATMTLLATGLVGLAGARRRKKTRA